MKHSPARDSWNLLERCRVGVFGGLGLAAAYSAFVIVMYLVTGGANLESRGLALSEILTTYLFGGIAGGIVFGLTAPLAATRIGAAVVGTLIMLPVFAAGVLLHPEASLDQGATWAAIITCAVIIGGGGTYSIWEPDWGR
jgi:hypothetical protein